MTRYAEAFSVEAGRRSRDPTFVLSSASLGDLVGF